MNKAYIVDDDPIHQFGMKLLLKRVEFSKEILAFYNGQEAIDALLEAVEKNETLPSIIFLDLNMPIKDGWGFLDDFVQIPHNNRKKITVYVVSSSIDPVDLERAKTYEVVSNYIVKPIEESQLVELLAQLKNLDE
ncbi:response regulator [Flagellimonas okinawensis]|uniref:Response regulator n=1 Tax=Flagellimonas okinawensis TaxID=3031324 RepID=A0ABT5XTG7_9FLAO|nr:response regulator [[Muricauda] okinawensis]MDF0709202.1 response regulator [[Muricauda] okinawensis]